MRKDKRARLTGALVAAIAASMPVIGYSQVSGTWSFNGDGNWSDGTKWSSNPLFPSAGGIASFGLNPLQNSSPLITLDTPVTLAGFNFNSPFIAAINTTGVNSFTLVGPATIDAQLTSSSTPSLLSVGHQIGRPIIGSAGLTKTGPAVVSLTSTNTFTGGLNFNGGTLRVTTGNAALGDVATGSLFFDGGTLRVSTLALTTARVMTMNAGGGTLEAVATGTYTLSGNITGTGAFNRLGTGQTVVMTAANTLQGALNNLGGNLFFQGAGSALNASSYTNAGTIILDNGTTNSNDRLAASVPMTTSGAVLTLLGNSAASTSESVGAITQTGGVGFFTVTPNAAQNAQLILSSFTAQNHSSIIYRGTNLGAAPAAGVANILLASAPTLVGGGGLAGSTSISIIPAAAGSILATNNGDSVVTYGITGVRPLATSEYVANIAIATANDNVRITGANAVASDTTINSLVVGTGGSTSGAGKITVNSGMVVIGAASTLAAPIDFGSREGVIHVSATSTVSGPISGSNGLIRTGVNNLTLGNASTYTGQTTLLAGTTTITANVPKNAPSAFGNSSDPIVLEPGVSPARLYTSLDGTIFDRDIIVRGNSPGAAAIGTSGTQAITYNGTVTLERPVLIEGAPTRAMTFNGKVTGPGRMSDNFATIVQLNGNNDFSGGIEINVAGTLNSQWIAGSDTAFGSGTIWFANGTGTIAGANGPRTLANPIAIFSGAAITGSVPMMLTGNVDLGSGIVGINTINSATTTLAGVIRSGGFVKNGAGRLVLTGSNVYTAGTTVNNGTLQVDNVSGSGTGAGPVTISAGALTGTGTIAGPVSIANGAILAPGDSPGTLHTGALSLSDTSSLLFELDQPFITGSGINDLMAVTGDLTLDGQLSVTPLANFANGLYPLFTYTGTLINNNVIVNPIPFPGAIGTIDTTTTPGVVYLNVVPEPTTMSMLAIASAGLFARRRRRAI